MAIFLYTFFGEMVESVEENRGVAIFLYTFLGKMDESVEETQGRLFSSPFLTKISFLL